MKVNVQAWCAYHIMVDQEIEVSDTSEATIETAIRNICEQVVNNPDTRPEPALMEAPTVTAV